MAQHRRRSGRREAGQSERKLRQLCAQIARSIETTLVGECRDEVLQNMSVQSVEPAAGNRLVVTLMVYPPGSEMPREQVLERLETHRPMIVEHVMRAVTRRSLPQLSFWLVLADPSGDPPNV